MSNTHQIIHPTHPCLHSILVDEANELQLEPESAGLTLGLGMDMVGEVETFAC